MAERFSKVILGFSRVILGFSRVILGCSRVICRFSKVIWRFSKVICYIAICRPLNEGPLKKKRGEFSTKKQEGGGVSDKNNMIALFFASALNRDMMVSRSVLMCSKIDKTVINVTVNVCMYQMNKVFIYI